MPTDLPLAQAAAFSLDDAGTTEIDDAFSVTRVSDDELRIGIHIAAPALAFAPGSGLDAIARERLSTAYMPGRKFTMLPADTIAALSLDEGAERPAVSLYLNVGTRGFRPARPSHEAGARARGRQPAPRATRCAECGVRGRPSPGRARPAIRGRAAFALEVRPRVGG
jgi:hypothetical protein